MRIKFLPSALLILCLFPSAASAAFPDVRKSHPFYDAILFVQERGIVSGYGDGTYRPEASINRAEFTKIIMTSLFDQSEIDACLTPPFSDVRRGEWFASYICIAEREGIIEGYPSGRFGPGQNINMAEAAAVVARALKLPLEITDPWYKPAIDAILEYGNLPEDFFRVSDALLRGEMAAIIAGLRTELPPPTPRDNRDAEHDRQQRIDRIVVLTNEERTKVGLHPLRTNSLLMKSAQFHAIDMELRQYFNHVSPEGYGPEHRIKATGYMDVDFDTCNCERSEVKVGENIAQGFATPEEIMNGWMTSEKGHRENILSPDFEEIGIGLSASGEYWVQHFGAVKTE